MSRRRKKNPLLGRILLISVIVHVIALPILAHFGAFKKIQQSLMQTQMVVLPPPEQEKAKDEVKKPKQVAQKTKAPAKTASNSSQKNNAPKSNLNQPKVVASNSVAGSDGGGGEPTVDPNGSGKAGQLPTVKNDGGEGGTPKTDTTPKTEPKIEPKTEPKVEPKTEPKAEPKVEPKKEPVYADVQTLSSPEPVIPDDLRTEALEKVFVAEFRVGADGVPKSVKTAQSTGIPELDDIALAAARKWRFRPATKDGEPIEQTVRLRIEFKVEG